MKIPYIKQHNIVIIILIIALAFTTALLWIGWTESSPMMDDYKNNGNSTIFYSPSVWNPNGFGLTEFSTSR